ncbi:hypothetical protein [Rhodopirellula sallentina]|uniref:Uncharacterized protein n=1 Tax=Rhodopirellula sallentina SM41 TaxID=1263870 RepID=M5U9B3_9BACT|nr:hypothetical protein [Rhodopirellula sallentina]EMI54446.1 hypothetical protein RSSM_04157 [Rhodopirellula sallentina SM41]
MMGAIAIKKTAMPAIGKEIAIDHCTRPIEQNHHRTPRPKLAEPRDFDSQYKRFRR